MGKKKGVYMKKILALSVLLTSFSLSTLAQSVELSKIFTNKNKILNIQVPVSSFFSHSKNGDCNGLPNQTGLIGIATCHVSFILDQEFRKTYIGPDFKNVRDPLLVGNGYGPKVLEELKKSASNGMVTGNLFVKYLYQPAWHTFGSHGSPAMSICSLIVVPQVSLVISAGSIQLEFKNAPYFNTTGQPYVAKGRLDDSLCPKL